MCKTGNKQIHEVTEASCQVSDSFFVETISEDKRSSNLVFVEIKLDQSKKTVSFSLDTGAQVNVIPLKLFHQLKCQNLEKKTHRNYMDMGENL